MENQKKFNPRKTTLYVIIGVLTVASLAFRWIDASKLEQTSVLFVGLPALIAILLVKFQGPSKSVYGIVFKTMTLFLVLSSILLGEGTICVLMAAPIFYAVGALVAFIWDYLKKRDKTKMYSFIIIPVLLLVGQAYNFNAPKKTETVSTHFIVSEDTSFKQFNTTPDLNSNLPTFLTIGFPKPIAIVGNGINVGDTRTIQFESTTKGIGELKLEITKSSSDEIIFTPVKDDSHINHWLSWKEMKVNLKTTEDGKKQITWTSKYQCELGPEWYFKPFEHYAVQLSSKHLINCYFKK